MAEATKGLRLKSTYEDVIPVAKSRWITTCKIP